MKRGLSEKTENTKGHGSHCFMMKYVQQMFVKASVHNSKLPKARFSFWDNAFTNITEKSFTLWNPHHGPKCTMEHRLQTVSWMCYLFSVEGFLRGKVKLHKLAEFCDTEDYKRGLKTSTVKEKIPKWDTPCLLNIFVYIWDYLKASKS